MVIDSIVIYFYYFTIGSDSVNVCRAVFSPLWMRWALTSQCKCRRVVSMQKTLALCPLFGGRLCERTILYTYSWLPDSMCEFLFFLARCRVISVPLLSHVCHNDDDNDAMQKHQRREWWRQSWASFQNLYWNLLSNTVFTFEKETEKSRSRIRPWGKKTIE